MVALLGVVSLMKADSVEGASTTQLIMDNAINIQVVDEDGNEFKYGYVDIWDSNGKQVTRVYVDDNSVTNYNGYRIFVTGKDVWADYSVFQKYVTAGTVKGVVDTTLDHSMRSEVSVNANAKKIRVCYTPNNVETITLNPNTLGMYVDPKWKNTDGGIKTTVERPFSSYTGLMTQTLAAGYYSTGFVLGTGATYSTLSTSSVKTEYYKARVRLIELDSRFTSNGVFVNNGQLISIASGNSSKCAMIYFISGNFVTVPVPDSQGYVEVYVDKSTGTFGYNVLYENNGSSGAGGGSIGHGCFMQEMIIQTAPKASLGTTIMNLPAGTYKLSFNPIYAAYKAPAEQTIQITNTGTVKTCKFVVHKHNFDTWKSDGTYHWHECCGTVSAKGAHSFGSWSVDKAATETSVGQQSRKCATCKYVETAEIPKLSHSHSFNSLATNSTHHWKSCKCGEKLNYGEHTFGSWVIDKAATETATGEKHRDCTYCGRRQTETIAKLAHTHKPSTTWSKDDSNHWKTCTCGSKLNNAAHSYTWVIDKNATTEAAGSKHQECTTCGYKKAAVEIPKLHKHSYGDWKNNTEGHWHECSCGNKQDYETHSSIKEATETTAKVCDACGYIMAPATGHINHIADGSKYYYDENTHWYQCVGCTLKMVEKEHSFEWIVDWDATEDIAGQKHEECKDCGYKKEAVEIPQIIIETEPATEAPTEEPTETLTEQPTTVAPTEPATEAENDADDNGFNWIWLVVGIVAALGVMIAIIIILAKKKKKEE